MSLGVTIVVSFTKGSVRVTDAVPDALVVAITLVPLLVPFDSMPAAVVNRIAVPAAEALDGPGFTETVRGCDRAVPAGAC